MKLWAYGDSHTAGAELGYSEKTLAKYRPGAKFGNKKYAWNRALTLANEYSVLINDIACAPEYSWTGCLAKLYNVDEYICRAIPGWSNDGAVQFMLEDRHKWNKDDIIVWGVATPWRYTPTSENLRQDNHQPARFPRKISKIFLEYGPSDDTSKLWTQGLMQLANTLHENLHMVQMSMNDLTVNGYNCVNELCVIDKSLGKFMSEGNYETLPNTHYDRACHNDFAEMIYNTLGDKHG